MLQQALNPKPQVTYFCSRIIYESDGVLEFVQAWVTLIKSHEVVRCGKVFKFRQVIWADVKLRTNFESKRADSVANICLLAPLRAEEITWTEYGKRDAAYCLSDY